MIIATYKNKYFYYLLLLPSGRIYSYSFSDCDYFKLKNDIKKTLLYSS